MPNQSESKPMVAIIDGRGGGPSTAPTGILSISDPCSGNTRQYLTHKLRKTNCKTVGQNDQDQSGIYEIQSLPHPRSETYSSFFVDSRVVSNPHLHLVTPMDPLYFLLPYFENEEKWQPWNQIVEAKAIPSEVINRIDMAQLKHLFLVNDSYGDDMILYKFKKEQGLDWLKKKMIRVEDYLQLQVLLQEKRIEAKEQNGGAFNTSFHLSSNSGPGGDCSSTPTATAECANNEKSLTSSQKALAKQSAAQVICEYLSDRWQVEFLKSQSMTRECLATRFQMKSAVSTPKTIENSSNTSVEVTPPPSTSALKRPFSEPKMTEADKLMQYTLGNVGGESTEQQNAKKAKESAQSVGLKKLSKVNTKGMKSMTSFFTAKPKKKN